MQFLICQNASADDRDRLHLSACFRDVFSPLLRERKVFSVAVIFV